MDFLDPLSPFGIFLASLIFAEPIAFLVDSLACLNFLAAFFTAWWFA